jgi:isocitrate/isopropylmalate dehydrogenase
MDYLGHRDAARRVDAAVSAVVSRGTTTQDLGGTLSTKEVGMRVCEHLAKG